MNVEKKKELQEMTKVLARILAIIEKMSRKKDVDNYVEIGDFFLKEGVMLFFCKKNVKAFCNFDVKKQVKP